MGGGVRHGWCGLGISLIWRGRWCRVLEEVASALVVAVKLGFSDFPSDSSLKGVFEGGFSELLWL